MSNGQICKNVFRLALDPGGGKWISALFTSPDGAYARLDTMFQNVPEWAASKRCSTFEHFQNTGVVRFKLAGFGVELERMLMMQAITLIEENDAILGYN